MSTRHLTYLDSLRGLAALTVVFAHYTQNFRMGPFMHTGKLAVCLFFILSGFVLSQRFLGTGGMKWAVIEAVIKRPFRLLGVVWVTVILGVIIGVYVQGAGIASYGRTWTQFAIDFFVSPFATGEYYNAVLWTISWEVWGSMIVFGTVFCCGTLPKYLRLVIFSSLFILNIHNLYCAFMAGMIIADLHKNFHAASLVKYRNLIAVPLLISGIAMYVSGVTIPLICDGISMLTAIIIFAAVMLNTGFIRSILEWQPVNFLGNISYSLYAVHFLLMKTIIETIDTMLNKYLQHDIAYYGTILITLPMIVFAAWIMDKYVDRPSIKLAAEIARRAVSVITLEVKMRGSKLKFTVMLRVPLNLLKFYIRSHRRYSRLING